MSVKQARIWIKRAKSITGFTGAGISTESGIPDFRSPNGVWSRNRTIDFNDFIRNQSSRIESWRQKISIWQEIRSAEPNAGHVALVELARLGKLKSLITQNIDGLHQRSGLSAEMIFELHGNTLEVICLSCKDRLSMDEAVRRITAGEQAPLCHHCGGILKTATVSFGQPMPRDIVHQAEKAAVSCELFLVVGSSLVVYPAANLPVIAKHSGAKLIIINRSTTPLDNSADLVINGEIGEVLPSIIKTP